METHNHPPCVGIVNGCDYCQTYGNVFQNGPINYRDALNVPFVYALRNKQIKVQHDKPNNEIDKIQSTNSIRSS